MYSIQPTLIVYKQECDEDMNWDKTPAGENATLSRGCYDGTVDG